MNAVRLFAAVLLTLVVAAQGLAQIEANEKPLLPGGKRPQPMSYQQLRERLKSPVTIQFVETPLKDVVAYLGDFLEVQFVVDVNALEEAGVSIDAPVTLNLRDINASSGLRVILDQVASGSSLVVVRREGFLEITTREKVGRELEPRVYPIRDLPAASPESPQASLHTTIDLIRKSVEPMSWDMESGEGTIATLPTVLVIRQSPLVHDKIDELLHSIREATDEAAK